MALWSVPVYAGIPRDPIVKQYKHYKKAKTAYNKANDAQEITIDHTNIEQLKQDMEKKKDILNKAKNYQEKGNDFNEILKILEKNSMMHNRKAR